MKKYENGKVVEMNTDEIAALKRITEEMPPSEPTLDERVSAMEATTDDMILLMAELIGGN